MIKIKIYHFNKTAMLTWIFAIRPSLTNVSFSAGNAYAIPVDTVANRAMALFCFKVSICFTAWYESSWEWIGCIINSLTLTGGKCYIIGKIKNAKTKISREK